MHWSLSVLLAFLLAGALMLSIGVKPAHATQENFDVTPPLTSCKVNSFGDTVCATTTGVGAVDLGEVDQNHDFYATKVTVGNPTGATISEIRVSLTFPTYAAESPINHLPQGGFQCCATTISFTYYGIGFSVGIPTSTVSWSSSSGSSAFSVLWDESGATILNGQYVDFAIGVYVPEGSSIQIQIHTTVTLWRLYNQCSPVCTGITDFQYVDMYGNLDTNHAQFISQSPPPSAMTFGQTAAVSVTMKNTGYSTWRASGTNPYRLGSRNPQDNSNWGASRVGISSDVASGSQYTFSWTITAPSNTATYSFQWQMVQESVEWFGDQTPNTGVYVAPCLTSAGPTFGQISVTVQFSASSCTFGSAPYSYNWQFHDPNDTPPPDSATTQTAQWTYYYSGAFPCPGCMQRFYPTLTVTDYKGNVQQPAIPVISVICPRNVCSS